MYMRARLGMSPSVVDPSDANTGPGVFHFHKFLCCNDFSLAFFVFTLHVMF